MTTILLKSGSGLAGSVYTSSDGTLSDWFLDGELSGMGTDFTLPLDGEGKKLRGGVITPSSNTIEVWVPQTDLAAVCAVMDIRTRRTPTTGAVQSWASRAKDGVASQAVVANRPVYGTDAIAAGMPGLAYDGTDFLEELAVGATSNSRTVVALAKFTNAADHRTIVGGTGSHFVYRRNNARQMSIVFTNTAAIAADTVVVPDNTPVLAAVRYTQATVADWRQNGAQTARNTPSGNGLPQSLVMQIGRNPSGQMMLGAIGSIVIADAYVSDDDILRIEGWLAHSNGAASLLPAGHPYKNHAPTVAQQDTATNHVLLGDPHTIQARGRTIDLLRRTIIGASPAAVQARGQAADLQRVGTIGAAPGSVTGSGRNADLRTGRAIAAGAAPVTTRGQAAEVRAGRNLATQPATATTKGQASALITARRLEAMPGRINTSGRTITLAASNDVRPADTISRGGPMLRMSKLMGR